MTHHEFFEQLLRFDFNRSPIWIAAVAYGRARSDQPDLQPLRMELMQDRYLDNKATELAIWGLLRWATTLDVVNRSRLVRAISEYDPDIHFVRPEADDVAAFNDSIETAPDGGPMP